MHRRMLMMLAAVLGWFLLAGTNAEAGLITETADLGQWLTPSMAGDSQPAESSPRPRQIWHRVPADAALLQLAPTAPGSMSSHATDSPTTHTTLAALPAAPPQLRSQLTFRLSPENQLWTPPPFLSGIFRPPRI